MPVLNLQMLLNGRYHNSTSAVLNIQNRAFVYGDIISETLHACAGRLCFFDAHIKNLVQAMQIAQMNVPQKFLSETEEFKNEISKMLVKNKIFKGANVRISVFRSFSEGFCAELIEMRRVEGERLVSDLLSRLDTVLSIRESIAVRAPLVVEDYRSKLNERIASILESAEVDTARLATEVALFADKANIDEELVRLQSHVAAARELLNNGSAVGRKMDFIVQEMNREFNTIGSKANDKDITALVIEGKAEIEKIREQVQNLE